MKTYNLPHASRFVLSTLCFSMLAPTLTFARDGANTGGGGGSIVCFKSPATLTKVKSQQGKLTASDLAPAKVDFIEAYDLYQAEAPRGLNPSAKLPVFDIQPSETYPAGYGDEENYSAYIERLAKRFELTVPAVSDLIREGAIQRAGAKIGYADGVAQIDDANPVMDVPDVDRCALITTAYQYNEGGQLYIVFDRRLMSHPKNSQLSRAVLNLHEDLYALGRTRAEHKDSRATRDLISEILPAHITSTQKKLLVSFDNLGFSPVCANYAECNGFSYDRDWISFVPPGIVLDQGTFTQRQMLKTLKDIFANGESVVTSYDSKYAPAVNMMMGDGPVDADHVYFKYTAARSNYELQSQLQFWNRRRAQLQATAGTDPSMIAALDAWFQTSQVAEFENRGATLHALKIGEVTDFSAHAECSLSFDMCLRDSTLEYAIRLTGSKYREFLRLSMPFDGPATND